MTALLNLLLCTTLESTPSTLARSSALAAEGSPFCKAARYGGPAKSFFVPGMAVAWVYLMLVSHTINDEPVGYAPLAGPEV